MIDTGNILVESLNQALETMAFLTLLPCNEQPSPPMHSFLVQMDFKGPASGKFQILVGEKLCKKIAENIIGVEVMSNNMAIDVLKELANVTSGLVLPMLTASEDDVFDLSIPEVEHFGSMELWENFTSQSDILLLDVEGSPVAARLVTD